MSILAAYSKTDIREDARKLSIRFIGSIDDLMLRMRQDLHGGQRELFDDLKSSTIGVVAGYGSGKTTADTYKAVQLAALNPGCYGGVLEPTNGLVEEIWIPKFDATLERFEIPYTYRVGAKLHEYTIHFPDHDSYIVCRSFENYKRIVGPDWAWSIGDEVDTVKTSEAFKAHKKIVGRVRVGKVRQKIYTSTPEGFGFHYQMFNTEALQKDATRRLIRMRSDDNPHLPADYFEEMEKNYTAEELRAYREGIYTNMLTGSVWYKFKREKHVRPVTLEDDDTLILGVDFNIGNTNGVLSVRRGKMLLTFDHIKAHDTEALGREIRRKYPERRIDGYPDASGANRSTNSTRSDVAILQEFGISNYSPKANPPVRDRIISGNARLENAKGEINVQIDPSCKKLIEDLEQHCYDEKGEPDKKSGNDHSTDAWSYPIHRLFEIGKATAGKAVRGVRLY